MVLLIGIELDEMEGHNMKFLLEDFKLLENLF